MRTSTTTQAVWVVDDDVSIGWVLEKALHKQGYQVEVFRGVKPMLMALKQRRPNLVISDIQMPGVNGLKLLEMMHENFPEIPVIIMTAYSDFETTISSYKKGAFEYLAKPFDIQKTLDLVKKALLPPVKSDASNAPFSTRFPARAQWQQAFERRVNKMLDEGKTNIAHNLYKQIDEILIQAALQHTEGHKQQAAKILGWGRNTLTRKIQGWDR